MPIGSYSDQLGAIRARNMYDQQVAFASKNANPQIAQNVVAQGQAYPWMTPQTAYALGAGGYQPGDPVSHAVATASINKRGGGFWHSLGQVVTSPMRAAAHLGITALHDVGAAAMPAARGLLTAAETPFQVGAGVLRDVASATGDIGAGIASGVATGAAVGLAGGPLAPISVAAGAVTGGLIGGVVGGVAQARGVKVDGGFVNPLAQSSGGLALGHLMGGEGVDLGSGYLPGGAIKEEQAKNARAAAAIDGHALTPGRFLASSVLRPGTTPYNLLSGVTDAVTQWNLDPAKLIGEDVAAARAGGKIIPGAVAEVETAGPISSFLARRAGLLDSADPAVASSRAREFLTTDGAAQRFIAKTAATDSAAEIRAASGGKISASIANQLKAASSEQDVLDILLSGVEGGDLKERAAVQAGRSMFDTVTNTRPAARLNQVMERLGGYMPEHTVDLLDVGKADSKLDNAVNQMDRFLKQARYTAEERNPILDRLMAATNPEEASRVFNDTIDGHLRDRLMLLGHDETTVDKYLGKFKTDSTLLQDSATREIANNTVPKAIHTGEELVPVNQPNQVLEHSKYTIHLPDPTDVRRLTTPQNTKIGESLSALYNSDGWKSSVHAGDWFMQKFKVGVTVRPALAVRTMIMQHAKMAANGLETRFSDPASLLRMVTNPEFRTAVEEGALEGTPLVKAEAYQKTMRKISGHIAVDDQAAHQLVVGPGHDLFPEAWASRLAEQHADPVARSIAGQGYEGTAQSFWDGPLASERHQLAVDLNKPELLDSREAADAYVKDTVGSHLSALTADNPHVMEAIATGHIPTFEGFDRGPGIPLLADHADGLVNPDAIRHLEGMALDDTIRVPVEVPAANKTKLIDPDYGHKVSRMTSWFYNTLISKPMDFFYQSPALNQLYWKELAGQAHLLDADGIEKLSARIATNTNKVRIPEDARTALEAALAHPNAGQGKVMLTHLDELAKARAVDGLQAMTIDMTKKRGWQDAARLMVPFGKHWEQELTQWTKLAVDHPEAFRKAQMTVQGGIGNGWFHKNDQGEYVFNYPGSDLISKIVTGTPTPMTAKVSGVAAMTSGILPGFGPLVSIPASKLLPNKPEYDEIRNFINPMGDPLQKGALSSVEPAWFKTLTTALADPENDRDAANTTMQIARYLVSTGKYNTNTPEAQDELLKEAGSRARKLLMLQALGKAVLPSSPTLTPMAQDKDGRTVTAKLLSDDLQKMRTDDYEHSSENFLAKYGDSAMLFLQASSRPLVPGAASTTEQSDFLRANPEIAKALPNSAAFFAPQGGQTFDPASIARQIHTGERQALSPKQQVALANDQVGSMIYYQLKGSLGTRISQPQQAALAAIKDQLMQAYPGFNVIVPGIQARAIDSPKNVQDVLIPELQKSLTIDKTKNSETGRALDQYLQLRDAVDAVAQKRGLKPGSFSQSTTSTDLRAFLRNTALQLSQNNQGFSMLFDRILDRELKTDTQAPAPLAASA